MALQPQLASDYKFGSLRGGSGIGIPSRIPTGLGGSQANQWSRARSPWDATNDQAYDCS